MTIEQFRATGRDCADIGAAVPDEVFRGGERGRLYLDSLFIVDTHNSPGWEEAKARGCPRWWTILDRDEPMSDDLAEVEAALFDWAAAAGYR